MNWGVLLLLLVFHGSTASARTPAVQDVQREALRYGDYRPGEPAEWNKVRWAAALPRLQVGFDRQLKDLVSLTTEDNVSISGGDVTVGPNENRFDQDFQQGTAVEVKAVWFLDELIFSRDRLEASRERRDWTEGRSRLLEKATLIYFEWRQARGEKREQLAGLLDAYTGGWFSEELRR